MGKTSLVLNIAQHVGTKTERDRRRLQPRDVEGAAVPAHADLRGPDRRAPAAQRLPRSRRDWGRLLAGARHARARPRIFIDDTPSIGVLEMRAKCAAADGGARPPPAHRRLHPADAGARALREPHPRAGIDLAVAQGAGQGAERPGRRAVAAEPRARVAVRSPPQLSDLRESGRARAGRRRRHVHLSARTSTTDARAGGPGHRRAHHRQAAQRADRRRQARVPQGAHRFENLAAKDRGL